MLPVAPPLGRPPQLSLLTPSLREAALLELRAAIVTHSLVVGARFLLAAVARHRAMGREEARALLAAVAHPDAILRIGRKRSLLKAPESESTTEPPVEEDSHVSRDQLLRLIRAEVQAVTGIPPLVSTPNG